MTDTGGDPTQAGPAEGEPSRWPPALATSCVFGTVGAVLLLAGLVTGTTTLVVAASAAGSLSLGAALVWRAQLIRAWHENERREPDLP